VETIADAESAVVKLSRLGPAAVVITLGGDGAVWFDGSGSGHVPAPPVDVVDTTGAGDAFVGTLAARLAFGDALPDAVAAAVRHASSVTTGVGAPPRDLATDEEEQ
jgi:ribokinase